MRGCAKKPEGVKNNNSPAKPAATGRHCERSDLPSLSEAGFAKAGAIQGTRWRIEKVTGLTAEDAACRPKALGRRGEGRKDSQRNVACTHRQHIDIIMFIAG